MPILLNMPSRNLNKVRECLHDELAKIGLEKHPIFIHPECDDPEQIDFAVVWKHAQGSLKHYKNLAGISSFGAGVDAIFADKELPNVPVVRIVDDHMSKDMARFVMTVIQHHKLRLAQFAAQKEDKNWKPKRQHTGNRVGILGYGELGKACAELLRNIGFDVCAWSRSLKNNAPINVYTGQDGFHKLIRQCDYLVCLLPLTSQTSDILNTEVFEEMKNSAVLINVARGQHLVDDDLVKALDTQQLDAAYLDVFREEPLPEHHPFWEHDKIIITPHISAVTNLTPACQQIAENYKRLLEGKALLNQVDTAREY